MSMVQGEITRPRVLKIERRGRPARPINKPSVPEPMSGVLWKRLIDHGHRVATDRRITTELGRLFWQRVLTTTQVVAGFRVAEIYGRFESSQGFPRRNARSPAYDGAYGGVSSLDDPKWAQTARENWRKLNICIPSFELRPVIEALCVDNLAVNPTRYPEIRAALNRIAAAFEITPDRGEKRDRPLHFDAHKK